MNVTLICDASFDPISKIGGYGYWIASQRGKQGGGGAFRDFLPDALVAEEMAIVNTVAIAIKSELVLEFDEILIQTDCAAAILTLSAARVPKQGIESEVIAKFNQIISDYKLKVEFRHVKGHTRVMDARSITNRKCDQRAKEAMREKRRKWQAEKYIQQIKETLDVSETSA